MTNRTYDLLKIIGQVVLPALGALYAALSALWGLPYAEPIVGTIAAVTTFLNAVVVGMKKSYDKKGGVEDDAST